MAELISKKFGTLEYQPDSAFVFPQGMPAFEREREFVPIENPATAGLVYLQSTRTPELCFLALPMAAVDAQYQLEVGRDDLRLLGLDTHCQPQAGRDVLVLALICIGSDAGEVTVNLAAPVVVNLSNHIAVQAVRSDSRYSSRRRLHSESGEETAPGGSAC